jgi:hypothetical protein
LLTTATTIGQAKTASAIVTTLAVTMPAVRASLIDGTWARQCCAGQLRHRRSVAAVVPL